MTKEKKSIDDLNKKKTKYGPGLILRGKRIVGYQLYHDGVGLKSL